MAEVMITSKAEHDKALRYADELEAALMEIMNGQRKPGKIPMEPMVRLCAYVRTGTTEKASIGSAGNAGVTVLEDQTFSPSHADGAGKAQR